MNRSYILDKLRPAVRDLLFEAESTTKLEVRFKSLTPASYVIAQYKFDPHNNIPTVFLGSNWEDVDVAHELMHMRLELIDGYYVLAWRQHVDRTDAIERAFGRVRAYVDDVVVHERLIQNGYELDGEVLRPALFDDLYTRVPSKLKKGRARLDNGMAHLDDISYGELCRSSFLVHAHLILQSYGKKLKWDRLKRVKRFIDEFRRFLGPETTKADIILEFFRTHNVHTVEGHKQILSKWSQLEGLDQFVGPSCYQHRGSRFALPFP